MAFPRALRANTRTSRAALAEDPPGRGTAMPEKVPPILAGRIPGRDQLDWERNYKAAAHDQWEQSLGHDQYRTLLKAGRFEEIAALAVRIESKTNLLFSFEKMALRDAVKSAEGARLFSEGLFEFLHRGDRNPEKSFERWCAVVGSLPRRQTCVLTWPVVTVFGFVAQPDRHIFLKPNVTRVAAHRYGFDVIYKSAPNWETYQSLLKFAGQVRSDLKDSRPRDMIDLQSFLWVQGSDEYA